MFYCIFTVSVEIRTPLSKYPISGRLHFVTKCLEVCCVVSDIIPRVYGHNINCVASLLTFVPANPSRSMEGKKSLKTVSTIRVYETTSHSLYQRLSRLVVIRIEPSTEILHVYTNNNAMSANIHICIHFLLSLSLSSLPFSISLQLHLQASRLWHGT